MFSNITTAQCDIPNKFIRKYNKENVNFIKIVSAEDRLNKTMRNKEIQVTAENPRIREQQEFAKICEELKLQLRQECVDEKKRQQLRENDLNLRDLQKQISAARVAKDLNTQRLAYQEMLAEKKCQKQKDIEERQQNHTALVEAMRHQELQAINNKIQFRKALKAQMKENEEKILQQKKEIMDDQRNMKALEAAMKAKKLNEWQQNEERKKQQQENIKIYLAFQEKMRNEKRAATVKEQEIFLQIQKELEEKEQRAKYAKLNKSDKTQQMSEQIGHALFKLQTEKKERENQLLDLLVEELKAIDDKNEQQSLAAKMQERVQLQMEYQLNQDLQLFIRNNIKKENEKTQQQQKQNAKDAQNQDKLAQIKRQQKAHVYAMELKEMIAANHLQRIADNELEKQNNEKHLKEQQNRLEEVKKEYLRLSEVEPADILKFLPLRHRRNCCT